MTFAAFGVAKAQDGPGQPGGAFDQLPSGQRVSNTVIELAGWIIRTGDNHGYPFAVIDKAAAQILVFGADGHLRGSAPGLFGSAIGDQTAAGVAGLALPDIPPADRTTPAGRFIGAFGASIGGGRVLWVDYDSAVSMHPLSPGPPAERRAERLASPSPADNRITHGCINVSPEFYTRIVRPTFQHGGLFYILPDAAPIAQTFPAFARSRGMSSGGGGRRTRRDDDD